MGAKGGKVSMFKRLRQFWRKSGRRVFYNILFLAVVVGAVSGLFYIGRSAIQRGVSSVMGYLDAYTERVKAGKSDEGAEEADGRLHHLNENAKQIYGETLSGIAAEDIYYKRRIRVDGQYINVVDTYENVYESGRDYAVEYMTSEGNGIGFRTIGVGGEQFIVNTVTGRYNYLPDNMLKLLYLKSSEGGKILTASKVYENGDILNLLTVFENGAIVSWIFNDTALISRSFTVDNRHYTIEYKDLQFVKMPEGYLSVENVEHDRDLGYDDLLEVLGQNGWISAVE